MSSRRPVSSSVSRSNPTSTGSLTDVPGIRIGHHHRHSAQWRTGTTVVVTEAGAIGGVDVRGGGPGTRETDLLRPENLVSRVHAICLTGGSAFGLAAADGVMAELESRGVGFPVGAGLVVPIVPTAVIFDLGRAGTASHRPDATFGRRATRAAFRPTAATPRGNGSLGAGLGARAGGLQGGIGMASAVVEPVPGLGPLVADGASTRIVVAALAVVNAVGSAIDPRTCLPWDHVGPDRSTVDALRRPSAADRQRFRDHLASVTASAGSTAPLNTTIGVVATNLGLTKAECTKFAAVAHDGLARAIRPAHSMHDGDTIFGLSTSLVHGPSPATPSSTTDRDPAWPLMLNAVLRAGADVFAAACTRAVIEATHVGGAPSYRDLCPSAFT